MRRWNSEPECKHQPIYYKLGMERAKPVVFYNTEHNSYANSYCNLHSDHTSYRKWLHNANFVYHYSICERGAGIYRANEQRPDMHRRNGEPKCKYQPIYRKLDMERTKPVVVNNTEHDSYANG